MPNLRMRIKASQTTKGYSVESSVELDDLDSEDTAAYLEKVHAFQRLHLRQNMRELEEDYPKEA